MKKIFWLFILGYLTCASVEAETVVLQKSEKLPVAAALKAAPAPETWEEKNAQQPFVYLFNHFEVVVNDDWSYTEKLHYRIKIQKESANHLGEQKVYYDQSREEIKDIQAFVVGPDGQQHPATKIQDLAVYQGSPMYSDFRVKVITLPQVAPGSEIEVKAMGVTKSKPIKDHYWERVSYPSVPTKLQTWKFVFPADKKIEFKQYKADYKPEIVKAGEQITYQFTFKESEDIWGRENFLPPAEELYGFASFSSITDWKVIVDWYRDLVAQHSKDEESIKAQALELTTGKETEKEKARAILEFIQDNFRYVAMNFGDHTVEPHSAADIFQNRYGDCKDWSLLARQMLDYVGIKSHICLFNDEFAGDPQHSLPQLSAFDHVILEVLVDGTKYFVDPQSKGYDFGEHPTSYDGAHVLVIEEQGFRFDQIPPVTAAENSVVSDGVIAIGADGSAVIDAQMTFGPDYSQGLRYMWKQAAQKDRDKMFEAMDYHLTKGGEMLERKIEGLEDRYGRVKMFLKFKRPNAYPVVNDMIIIKDDMDNRMQDFTEKERQFPIFMPNNMLMKTSASYVIPEGYYVDYTPPDYKIAVDFMELKKNLVKEGEHNLKVESTYSLKRGELPAQRYPEVKDFMKEFYKQTNQYIVLKKKKE